MYNISESESNCYKIVKMIMERNFAPVIVFSFSKKDCEAYAMQMSKLDFNTGQNLFVKYKMIVHASINYIPVVKILNCM